MSKKLLALLGSPHKDGATGTMLKYVLQEAEQQGWQITSINLYEQNIGYCNGCRTCIKTGNCVHKYVFYVEYISFLKEVANMRISEKAKKTVSRKTFMAVVVCMMVCLLFVTPVFAASSFYSKTTTKLNAINGGKSTTSRLVE